MKAVVARALSVLALASVAAAGSGGCGDSDESSALRTPGRPGDGADGGAEPAKDGGAQPPNVIIAGPSCLNGERDGDETDVDCGGETCPACANGGACAAPRDCVSLSCTGGKCSADVGCSDGTREGFVAPADFPNIAACAGGWSLPGLVTTTSAACGHVAGNSSANPTGNDCNVADLCQVGWHVCADAAEVKTKLGAAPDCSGASTGQAAFYLVRKSGSGGAMCGEGTNDLFGCGDVGAAPDPATCGPLNRFSHDLCSMLPATWKCGTDGANEQGNVAKSASEGGGVLCCRG